MDSWMISTRLTKPFFIAKTSLRQCLVKRRKSFANIEQRYEQLIDPYHNIQRLSLYRFDGSPIPVMYLAYRPPQMVPTNSLHPAATASAKSGAKERLRRALEQHIEGPEAVGTWIDTQRLWCFGLGVGTMGIGGVLMYLS